jgi:multidrug transporter EmrE-like cation transporter
MEHATELLLIVLLIVIFETFVISQIKHTIEGYKWVYLALIIAFNVIMSLIISQMNRYKEVLGNINVLWSRMAVLTVSLVGLLEFNNKFHLQQVFFGILITSGIMLIIQGSELTDF